LQGSGDTVKEFERRLKVIDTVIKYLSVRIDEDLERIEKFKALRAKQESKRRRSKPAAAPAPQPAAEAPQG
jgi:small subunit ribosomal protein S6